MTLFKQKQVRRSERFTPRYVRSSRRQKESVYSRYAIAILQLTLSIFMFIAAYQTYMMVTLKPNILSESFRVGLPLAFLCGALVFLKVSISTFFRLRREAREAEVESKRLGL
jgi:uncharacterized integral membrane protein